VGALALGLPDGRYFTGLAGTLLHLAEAGKRPVF